MRLVRQVPPAVAVGVGGALGTAARVIVSDVLPTSGRGWPTATLAVNLVGALLLGLLLEGLGRGGPDEGRRRTARLFVGTGFCGGLTTYSTFAVEVDLLARGEHGGLAAGYAVVSVTLGLLAAAAGIALAAVVRR